jgi:hypothetical protein
MYGQTGHFVRETNIASAATVTSVLTLGAFNALAVEIPTFAAGVSTTTANVYVQVCDTADGTFRRIAIQGVYSSGSGILDWEVPSSTGARVWQLPNEVANYNYAKIELSKTATAGIAVRVHCMM